MLINCNIVFDSETNEYFIVNSETGAQTALTLAPAKKASTKKTKAPKIKDETPRVMLDTNKITLNDKAVEVLGVTAGDLVTVSYMKIRGKGFTPVIGKPDVIGMKGNKLTKSNTLACRGKAYDELANYGTTFTLEAHPEGAQCFCLVGDKIKPAIPADVIADEPDQEVIDELSNLSGDEFEDATTLSSTDLASIINA